jgi:hypothetical protein
MTTKRKEEEEFSEFQITNNYSFFKKHTKINSKRITKMNIKVDIHRVEREGIETFFLLLLPI